MATVLHTSLISQGGARRLGLASTLASHINCSCVHMRAAKKTRVLGWAAALKLLVLDCRTCAAIDNRVRSHAVMNWSRAHSCRAVPCTRAHSCRASRVNAADTLRKESHPFASPRLRQQRLINNIIANVSFGQQAAGIR
jgi:hypothetical protein